MRRDFGVHFKLIFQRLAAHEREVFFRHFFRTEQIGERDECRLCFLRAKSRRWFRSRGCARCSDNPDCVRAPTVFCPRFRRGAVSSNSDDHGLARSGEVRSPAGLSSASRCSSSKRTGISQNSRVAGEESLMSRAHTLLSAGAEHPIAAGRRKIGMSSSRWLASVHQPFVERLVFTRAAQLGGELRQVGIHLASIQRQLRLDKDDETAVVRLAENRWRGRPSCVNAACLSWFNSARSASSGQFLSCSRKTAAALPACSPAAMHDGRKTASGGHARPST